MSHHCFRLAACLAVVAGALSLTACGSSRETAEKDTLTQDVGVNYPPPPAGAWQPRLGVPPFKVTGSAAGSNIGENAADQLTTLTLNTDRFQVIERAQLEQLLNEQGLAGVVKGDEMATPGVVRGVDFLIYGKVTNFRVKKESNKGGFGLANVGLPGGGSFGAFDYKNKNAKITAECGVDLRMVDPSSGQVMAANFSEYKRTDSIRGFGVEILGANAESDANLEVDEDNQGKILRLALDDALRKMLPKIDNTLKKGPPAKAADGTAPKTVAAPAAGAAGAAAVSGPTSGAGGTAAMSAEKPVEDRQWIQPDDYFTADRKLEGAYIEVKLAKMVNPPKEGSKDEAEFLNLKDGSTYWTKYFWQTRIATKDDIKAGKTVIVFDDARVDGAYAGPKNKDNARSNGSWFMCRLTDVSDLYKDRVKAATYTVIPGDLRVPVDAK